MPLIDNLVAYYKLDEPSGNALDFHGNLDLIDVNSVGSATGKKNTGRDLESSLSQNFYNTANASSFSFGDSDFSFSGWFNVESSSNNRTICSMGSFIYENQEYRLFCSSAAGTGIRWRFSISANGSTTTNIDGSIVSAGVWTFVCAGFDSVNNQIWISINGAPKTTVNFSATPFTGADIFTLGAHGAVDDWLNQFDGVIDEFAIWGKTLNDTDILLLYNNGVGLSYEDLNLEYSVKYPASQSTDSSIGDASWTNFGTIFTENEAGATADAAGSGTSNTTNYLIAHNFGFSIPTDKEVKAVIAQIKDKKNVSTVTVQDNIIKLYVGGNIVGNNKANVTGMTHTTFTYVNYGDISELWGVSLTPASVNASNFGLAMSFNQTGAGGFGAQVMVDAVKLIVVYGDPTPSSPIIFGKSRLFIPHRRSVYRR